MPTRSRLTRFSRYPAALWSPSPNEGPRREPIDLIVVHVSDGGPRLDHLVERLQDPGTEGGDPVSAHFATGRDGQIVQLVELDRKAWHCKTWNDRSIGIEHCARTPGELDRRGRWAALGPASRAKLLDHGGPADADKDPGLAPTAEQLLASARLVAWLCSEIGLPPDRQHIRPHCEYPATTHHDCGRDVTAGGIWPWSAYMEAIAREWAALQSEPQRH